MDAFEIIEANGGNLPRVRKTKDGFNRSDVVSAFQDAFTMVGGVSRLALWANSNPDKFFQLYAKLLPSTSYQFSDQTIREIHHALPPSALDMHPGSENRVIVPVPEETAGDPPQ